jgi:hypothetical protein
VKERTYDDEDEESEDALDEDEDMDDLGADEDEIDLGLTLGEDPIRGGWKLMRLDTPTQDPTPPGSGDAIISSEGQAGEGRKGDSGSSFGSGPDQGCCGRFQVRGCSYERQNAPWQGKGCAGKDCGESPYHRGEADCAGPGNKAG